MNSETPPSPRPFGWGRFLLFVLVVGLATTGATALLVNIFERKQEARNPFYRVVELTDATELGGAAEDANLHIALGQHFANARKYKAKKAGE